MEASIERSICVTLLGFELCRFNLSEDFTRSGIIMGYMARTAKNQWRFHSCGLEADGSMVTDMVGPVARMVEEAAPVEPEYMDVYATYKPPERKYKQEHASRPVGGGGGSGGSGNSGGGGSGGGSDPPPQNSGGCCNIL